VQARKFSNNFFKDKDIKKALVVALKIHEKVGKIFFLMTLQKKFMSSNVKISKIQHTAQLEKKLDRKLAHNGSQIQFQ
jgi:hypothetical protein